MPTKEHDSVVDVLEELCREYRYHGNLYYKEIVSSTVTQRPLVLIIPRKGGSLTREYYPDLYGLGGRRRQVDVYEVWHSETEDQAVSDILHSFLLPEVRFLGIVCTGYNITEEKARKMLDFFAYKFYDLIPPEKQNPLLRNDNYTVCQPSEQEMQDRAKTKSTLKGAFSF